MTRILLCAVCAALLPLGCSKENNAQSVQASDKAPATTTSTGLPTRPATSATPRPTEPISSRRGIVRLPDGKTRPFEALSSVISTYNNEYRFHPEELYFEQSESGRGLTAFTVPLSRLSRFTINWKAGNFTLETLSTDGKTETFHPIYLTVAVASRGSVATEVLKVWDYGTLTVEFADPKQ